MNRRTFLAASLAASAQGPLRAVAGSFARAATMAHAAEPSKVAVLLVDTDRSSAPIDPRIYGQFLEHINHSVEDGLFAEQVRGSGFEGNDYTTYWKPVAERGNVQLVDLDFQNGKKSVRLRAAGGHAGIRQERFFFDAGVTYDGSLWMKREAGAPRVSLRVQGAQGEPIASLPLPVAGSEWQQVPFSFTSPLRDTQASIEIAAAGHGAVLLDFVSLMRAQARREGSLRPDLCESLPGCGQRSFAGRAGHLLPPTNGSRAWGRMPRAGIIPTRSGAATPITTASAPMSFWAFAAELSAEPLIVLPAQGTEPEQVAYAMDWVRYLNDPPGTEWAGRRAANGHAEPYGVRYFQIDNEPMNNGFSAQAYAEIVNVYGSRLRAMAPQARIVACGQKRSSDMEWSENRH